jgi:hypothetical protein
MFERTDTPCAPWTVVRSNDKKRGRIAAFRWVLSVLDYPTKDEQVVGQPDPLARRPHGTGLRAARCTTCWSAVPPRNYPGRPYARCWSCRGTSADLASSRAAGSSFS